MARAISPSRGGIALQSRLARVLLPAVVMTRPFLILALLITLFLRAGEARACSRLPSKSVQNFTGLPLEGSLAPRNTRIWSLEPNARLVDATGKDVATETTTLSVQGEETVVVTVLRPYVLLEPSATYRLMNGAVTLSSFGTTAVEDREPPARPHATLVGVNGSYFGSMSCGHASSVTVKVDPASDFALMVEGAPFEGVPATALALGVETLTGYTLAEGAHQPHIIAFDLAGNSTEGDAVQADVPPRASGCSATGGASSLLSVTFLLWSRRSRAHRPR